MQSSQVSEADPKELLAIARNMIVQVERQLQPGHAQQRAWLLGVELEKLEKEL